MLRDRFGHWVQTLLACLFAFAGALDHAPLNIATVMLVTCFVIRLHASWRAMPTLLRVPALLPCALLTLWMLLGLAWTSGDATAIHDLTMLRLIVILPALWPVLDHAREIAIAFILGTMVQNGAQFLQLAEYIPRPDGNYWRYSGFINHPGDSALRSAMSIVLALALASSLVSSSPQVEDKFSHSRSQFHSFCCCCVGVAFSPSARCGSVSLR